MWMSVIADTHDSMCECDQPFAHLLASIFPPGHKDRENTIEKILIRDYKQLCLSGGGGDKEDGYQKGNTLLEEGAGERNAEDHIEDKDILDLLAAAEEDAAAR